MSQPTIAQVAEQYARLFTADQLSQQLRSSKGSYALHLLHGRTCGLTQDRLWRITGEQHRLGIAQLEAALALKA